MGTAMSYVPELRFCREKADPVEYGVAVRERAYIRIHSPGDLVHVGEQDPGPG